MKWKSALLIALGPGFLAAQSPAQEARGKVQIFVDSTTFHDYTLASVNNYVFIDKAKDQVGIGLRFVADFPDAPNWGLELGGRLPQRSKFQLNGSGGGWTIDNTETKLRYSWWSVGLGYALRPSSSFEIAFHLEGRGENLKVEGATTATSGGVATQYPASQGVNFWRPWVRISAEFSLPSSGRAWAPHFGADVSGALKNTTQDGVQRLSDSIHSDTTLKSMAPRWEASIYAGIQF
ncbi:hypothetical protein [Geothrix mesophila]|uniref:hypothetical protein n=1 Tax=Geothrix mesophila TaxID=2922723 RepID=UPI001FABC2CE|nr:hypothetical protein [Geothrix sp. SG198]